MQIKGHNCFVYDKEDCLSKRRIQFVFLWYEFIRRKTGASFSGYRPRVSTHNLVGIPQFNELTNNQRASFRFEGHGAANRAARWPFESAVSRSPSFPDTRPGNSCQGALRRSRRRSLRSLRMIRRSDAVGEQPSLQMNRYESTVCRAPSSARCMISSRECGLSPPHSPQLIMIRGIPSPAQSSSPVTMSGVIS